MTRPNGPAPRLVLLPGLDGTGDLFGPFLRALPDGVETMVVRYPADEALPHDALVRHVAGLTAGLGPHALVAESFSGPVAIDLVAAAPSGRRGLVLCASFARSPLPAALGGARLLARAAAFRRAPPRFLVRAALAGGGASRDLVDAVRAAVRHVAPEVLADRLRQVFDVDVTGALSRVAVPVLAITGRRDRLVGAGALRAMSAALPSLRTAKLDAPHLVLQTRPAEAAEAIVRFASGCP